MRRAASMLVSPSLDIFSVYTVAYKTVPMFGMLRLIGL